MVKLFRCEICGDPYIGESAPDNCPFCGAKKKHIGLADKTIAEFNVDLNAVDLGNVKHALDVELSNSSFYFCAAAKTDSVEGKLLFKCLAKVEAEHASIWKKILKLKENPKVDESCFLQNKDNLAESHKRELRAIDFYKKAASESQNKRIKQIFEALVEVETDHLSFSGGINDKL